MAEVKVLDTDIHSESQTDRQKLDARTSILGAYYKYEGYDVYLHSDTCSKLLLFWQIQLASLTLQ